jgi:signal transduction histidine kinase
LTPDVHVPAPQPAAGGRPLAEDAVFAANLQIVHTRTDHLFFWLLVAQTALAVGLAVIVPPPDGPAGIPRRTVSVVAGALLTLFALVLIRRRPGTRGTRYAVAVVQMVWSGLLIQLTGGRLETHFHVFGSLAFLAFYRDWRTLVLALASIATNHAVRAVVWPASAYAGGALEWWRLLEYGAWMTFEGVVLALGCLWSVREMRVAAAREAALAHLADHVEHEVRSRTAELAAANASLQLEMKARVEVETDLRQAHKLESVGRLAAGVAHEINTPVQFVSDSLHFLRDATTDLMPVIAHLREVEASVLRGAPSREAAEASAEAAEAADLTYLVDHMPNAIDRALDGLGRVASIVRSMKEFAHPDAVEMTYVDLNRAVESTLIIARNEYKYVADVRTDFGNLPLVRCHAGDVNQAVLNVVVNAAHAIGEVVAGTSGRGLITVQTRVEHDDVVVSITDTGSGIPEAIRDRICDPFFTTKDVGQGTGQGLAITRAVIVERHRGELTFESEVGRGTTCRLRLPIHGAGRGRPPGVAA